MSLPSPLPDDPKKWEGWRNYNSPNFYDRLCLSADQNPSNELIEDYTRQILVWWQKKLPLKNQPSNPVAQMLRDGLDNAPRFISEARLTLCNPEKRAEIDVKLLGVAKQKISVEFSRFFHFIASGGILTDEGEESLLRFGSANGMSPENVVELIAKGMEAGQIKRAVPEPVAQPAPVAGYSSAGRVEGDPASEFKRVLKLSGLDSDSMTDDQRDALINMAENLGVNPGDAEDMVDEFLEELDARPLPAQAVPPAKATKTVPRPLITPTAGPKPATARIPLPQATAATIADERQRYPAYVNSLGGPMLLVPSGTFEMGSADPSAGPNEAPCSKVKVSRFYISRFLITTGDYEKFNPAHKSNRGAWANDQHPVIYVSYLDATKFCQWLGAKEKRRYRLPSEAEWEYAARGLDGRAYPWGNDCAAPGKMANFADARTKFSWSDPDEDDGYAETSPVGTYPRGASAFGVEDMAGNVWEWCADFFEPYKGGERVNPRGPQNGQKRVYRGGSWRSKFSSLRATTRNSNTPDYRYNDLGFRIVCECE